MIRNKDHEQDAKKKMQEFPPYPNFFSSSELKYTIRNKDHDWTACKTVVVGYEFHQTTLCEALKGPVHSPSLQQHPTATKVEMLMSHDMKNIINTLVDGWESAVIKMKNKNLRVPQINHSPFQILKLRKIRIQGKNVIF